MKLSVLSKSESTVHFFVRVLLYTIVASNIMILSIVFLYPRLHFMLSHWGASEKELLLSEGSRDNPTMEYLREVYELMYFVKDHTEDKSAVYFINPTFAKAYAYKILLPRAVNFLTSENIKELFFMKREGMSATRYLVFAHYDKPDFLSTDEITWYEGEWGLYKHQGN